MPGLVEITVNAGQFRWYTERGYEVPTRPVQLWAKNARGEPTKNGVEHRVARGTRITVRREDLPPASNIRLSYVCPQCGGTYRTTHQARRIKVGSVCKPCSDATPKGDGTHGHWVTQLITKNPDARCDISGETDKRFLVLHHLLGRVDGGRNTPSNYVILSANYHLAFHNWNGGMNVPCTPEAYQRFKAMETANG